MLPELHTMKDREPDVAVYLYLLSDFDKNTECDLTEQPCVLNV